MNGTCPVITDPDRVRDALLNAPMPAVAQVGTPPGIAWLRARVPRFCDGPVHERRRALVEAELARISPDLLRRSRRVVDDELVELDLTQDGLGFGAGPHECPGREHAIAIATGIIEGS
jgi:cytochrome P450